MILDLNGDISLNGINLLIFVMVKCGVLFEVRTEFVSITKTSIGFKGLIQLATENYIPTNKETLFAIFSLY
jgi:hypothetical protein